MKIKCSCCKKPVELYEKVYLDTMNGITHVKCENKMVLPIKDEGPLWAIFQKYDFFNNLMDEYLTKYFMD